MLSCANLHTQLHELSTPARAELMQEPSALKSCPFRIGNNMIAVTFAQEIKNTGNRREPRVFFCQAFHQFTEPSIQLGAFPEVVPEMDVHEAESAILFQAILIGLAQGLHERFGGGAFRRAVPIIYKWPCRTAGGAKAPRPQR